MGRYKSLGSLNLFLSYAPQLSGASSLCLSHPELPWGSPQGVAAVLWLLDGRYSPSWVAWGLTNSHWRAIITDDCDILIYWCGRKYSIFIGMLSLGCIPYSCALWESWYPGENGFRRDPAPLLSIPRDPQPTPQPQRHPKAIFQAAVLKPADHINSYWFFWY